MEQTLSVAPLPKRRRTVDRVVAACDVCKRRKVKCDGHLPCGYCQRKNRSETCHFSGPKSRGGLARPASPPQGEPHPDTQILRSDTNRSSRLDDREDSQRAVSPMPAQDAGHQQEDTAVPLEARLLRDAQGKSIFIGDCAPLSFLQTVRHLIASEVDPNGFSEQVPRDSILEMTRRHSSDQTVSVSEIELEEIDPLVDAYFLATRGLVDLFDREQLEHELRPWAMGEDRNSEILRNALYSLVIAIGMQDSDEVRAEVLFNQSRDILQVNLCSSMNIASVQGFALVAVYMLRAFQPNGAYLYLSLAARTAYAVGLHRSEVNASFGPSFHVQRDRIWKSLRVLDIFISCLLGRPPSTSDVDCTVKYSKITNHPRPHPSDILDASIQMFMIIERIVVEVYSRKRISLRIATYVSQQLKGWAANWLGPLTGIIATGKSTESPDHDVIIGACSSLCSYYYGILLLTRPFLIYDLYDHLNGSNRASAARSGNSDKEKFADAALDAAIAFVDQLKDVIRDRVMPDRMPLIVAWLFTASLVLAIGVLGKSGLACEIHCKSSIFCLDHFAKTDPHARQYSRIVQEVLDKTTSHVARRDQRLRVERMQASSQLFGFLPMLLEQSEGRGADVSISNPTEMASEDHEQIRRSNSKEPDNWTFYDAEFFALPWINENDVGLQEFLQPGRQTMEGALADIPLFPMYNDQSFETFHATASTDTGPSRQV